MSTDEKYMFRCLQLATLAAGNTAPNPMVGAVLVHNETIIGEGYHMQYGGPHAEVNCINSVAENDAHLIAASTMYVSLEPCAHFGKTPPCAVLIIYKKIPRVVIGCRDPFDAVNGKGIEKLQQAGVHVTTGILENECRFLNRRFFNFHEKNRPYIILKWAQTADGFIAHNSSERLLISGATTNRLVHRWRSEEAAILVGTKTAMLDDPALTNRLWTGPSPVRIVIDKQLSLSKSLQLFDGPVKTFVLNNVKKATENNIQFVKIENDLVKSLMQLCVQEKLLSIIVEGGAMLLNSFIKAGLWDEARIITNTNLNIKEGLAAPVIQTALHHSEMLEQDRIDYYFNH